MEGIKGIVNDITARKFNRINKHIENAILIRQILHENIK